jgi:Carboxypeptidase regulatory-like domain
VLFRMTMAGVISGRVTDDNGQPMTAIQMVALRKPSEEEIEDNWWLASHKQEMVPAAAASTDDRGQYRIFGLNPGEYYIRATDSLEPQMRSPVGLGEDLFVRRWLGTDYASVYYPGVMQLDQAQTVLVRASDEAQANFSMQHVPTVEVAGRVLGPNGTPTAGTSVSLESAGGSDYSDDHSASTDDKGHFSLKSVPPGSYFLEAYQREDEKTYQSRQRIEVGKDNIESLTIVLGGGADFRGHVTVVGSGSVDLQRMTLALEPTAEDRSPGAWSQVKKDGTFEMTDVKDGDYAISVFNLEPGWYTRSARLGPDDVLTQGFQVEKGSSSGTIEVVISSATAQLEGSVTEADQPVTGARVRITPDPVTPYNRMRSRTVNTDQAGYFHVAGLAPGNYRVIARSTPSESSTLSSDSQTVTLSERDDKTIQLKIAPPPE